MQEAFGIVIMIVVALAVLAALVALIAGDRLYDHIGSGSFSLDRDPGASGGGAQPTAATGGEVREQEIRQMIDARNARLRRKGMPELDVDAELHRLTTPAVTPDLRAEIRQLVVARNERRARSGREPLDVEAEVDRRIAELGEG